MLRSRKMLRWLTRLLSEVGRPRVLASTATTTERVAAAVQMLDLPFGVDPV